MADVTLAAAPHRRLFARFPWHMAFLVLAISAIGVWNLASASRSAHSEVWIPQAWWMGVGMLVALGITLVDHRAFQRLSWLFYAVVVVLLVYVHFKGKYVMGARRWINFGGVNLQPSELAKIAVGLVMANVLASDADRRREPYGFFGLFFPLGIIALPAVLTLKQPDLGTALIVTSVGATQLLFARIRRSAIVIMAVLSIGGAAFGYGHLKDYQKKRIAVFINPEADVKGAGYHSSQSIIAIGSGQGTGKGWGQGTQTYLSFLPEQHTDFIFSVWAEEHGFVGCLLLLLLYFALLASAVDVAGAARDRFGQFLAVGMTGMLFWHVFINVGMVIGILPVVGVTLPLMSYGGSSVLAVFSAIGLLANIGMRRFVN
ncbi:MAG TPA: rod shape-determining protein RodA [Anaeromyxobacter sp.]|nr:rod shape-determining protein RodA [Anaeromyxobacter sp.]